MTMTRVFWRTQQNPGWDFGNKIRPTTGLRAGRYSKNHPDRNSVTNADGCFVTCQKRVE
jgi:hypothetical protein